MHLSFRIVGILYFNASVDILQLKIYFKIYILPVQATHCAGGSFAW